MVPEATSFSWMIWTDLPEKIRAEPILGSADASIGGEAIEILGDVADACGFGEAIEILGEASDACGFGEAIEILGEATELLFGEDAFAS